MSKNGKLPIQIGHIISGAEILGNGSTNVQTKPLNVVKHNSNGTYFMVAGNDKKVHLFNAGSAAHVKTYEAHGYEITDLAIAYDNARFASVGGDKLVFYWDVATAVTVRRFAGHFQRNNCVAFNDDASVIASGSYDATVRLWDTKSNSGVPIQVLDQAKDSVTSIVIKDRQIVVGSADGKVRTYDLRKGQLQTDTIGQPVTSVQSSSDQDTVLISSLDSTIRLLDANNGGNMTTFTGHRNNNYRIPSVYGTDGQYIVSGSEDGRVFFWETETGKLLNTVMAHSGKVVSGLSIHDRSKQLITCGGDGSIIMWT